MSYALDTNVLARSIEDAHPLQAVAVSAVDTLVTLGEELCIFPQNLYEFWVIATRPLTQNGLGLPPDAVRQHLEHFVLLFSLKLDSPTIFAVWKTLVTSNAVRGKPAHDARIVAAMKVHEVSHLLTFNTQDFKRFSEVTTIDPRDMKS